MIPPNKYYKIRTERLKFRPLKTDDIAPWVSFFSNNPTERFVMGDKMGSNPIEKATTWINKQIDRKLNGEFGQLAMVHKETGKLIGLAGLIARDLNGVFELEVTYSLLPYYWGKGYATEAAVKFKEFAFEHTELPSVMSIIHVENDASINVAKKNGMSITDEFDYEGIPVYLYRVDRTT